MAKRYQKTPSEILNIPNEYLAYCIDEVAYFLEINAMDKEGNLNWDKIRWSDSENSPNQEMINLIEGR